MSRHSTWDLLNEFTCVGTQDADSICLCGSIRWSSVEVSKKRLSTAWTLTAAGELLLQCISKGANKHSSGIPGDKDSIVATPFHLADLAFSTDHVACVKVGETPLEVRGYDPQSPIEREQRKRFAIGGGCKMSERTS